MRKMRSLIQTAAIVLTTGAAGAMAFNAWAEKADKSPDQRPPACERHQSGRPGPGGDGSGSSTSCRLLEPKAVR